MIQTPCCAKCKTPYGCVNGLCACHPRPMIPDDTPQYRLRKEAEYAGENPTCLEDHHRKKRKTEVEDQHLIELEMSYTKWNQACLSVHSTDAGEQRYCRRTKGHHNNGTTCASGFGDELEIWTHPSILN